jgi:hypothetical protein
MTGTVVRREAWRRWCLVAAAAVLLAGLPALRGALPAHAPLVAAADLVARIRGSASHPYQGFAISSGTAGLPTLPQLGDVSRLLDGETQLRTWYAGPDRWRVDTIGPGTERDLYQTPDGQVLWDFGTDQLSAVTGTAPVRLPRGADLVPPDLGRRLMAGDPARTRGSAAETGWLSTLPARRVAGIAAAGVRLTPRDAQTTIGRVDVWADPTSGLPLQVEVTPRGAGSPILVTRFLQVSLTTPATSALTPPAPRAGMGFTATDAPDIAGALTTLRLGPVPEALAGRARAGSPLVRVAGAAAYGTGFTQFVVLPVPRQTGFAAFRSATSAGGTRLELPAGEGVLLHTPLLSVLVIDSDLAHRTYVLAGLVDGALLTSAAGELSTYVAGA